MVVFSLPDDVQRSHDRDAGIRGMHEAIAARRQEIGRLVMRVGLALVAVWTVIVGVSLAWNIHRQRDLTFELVLNTARASFNKDLAYRLWASSHGGVYVEPTEKTPPSPWMAHLPDRDLTTTDGRKLTLMNPAYMVREMMQDFGTLYGIKGRIVGIVYLNPNNKADPWEEAAIKRFSAMAVDEVQEESTIDGLSYLRLIRPMFMEQSCQKCHGHLGFANGEVRGAVGVSVPMAPYREAETRAVGAMVLSHGVFWLLGLGVIGGLGRRTSTRLIEKAMAEEETRLAASVFANGLEGTIITNADGVILRANPAFFRLTGFTSEEVIGRRPSILRSHHHDDDFYRHLWHGIKEDGYWQGEITNRRKDGSVFVAWENIVAVRDGQGKIRYYIASISDITEKVQAQESIRRLAHYDLLTELPNRALFFDRLTHALSHAARSQKQIALLFLDLDGFKKVNDALGHRIGDELLQEVARRLRPCLRLDDTFARLGGDEFTVVLESVTERQDPILIAERILQALTQPFKFSGRETFISASIGISFYPEDGDSAEELLQHADTAMYQAKAQGKNCFRFYAAEMTRTERKRMELEHGLRVAVDQDPDQFQAWYQPIFCLKSRQVIAFEALVRWLHPTLGLISPADFIPLAEDMRLIDRIDLHVLRLACQNSRTWQKLGYDIGVTVNLSGVDLQSRKLAFEVAGILQETDAIPGKVTLELTEGFVLDLGPEQRRILDDFKSIGLKLAIDDFGTGYSSLRYLKQLPVNTVKIDRSFVRDIACDNRDKLLVSSIIGLAHSLNLSVVAEGIETVDQLDTLASQDCDHIQGYLISKPLPADRVLPWLAAYRTEEAITWHK
ncbi:diguanylate cyclase [uncultured Gammaproteobacteria bacterium]